MARQLISIDEIPDNLTPEQLDAIADELYDALVAQGIPTADQQAAERKVLADEVRAIKDPPH